MALFESLVFTSGSDIRVSASRRLEKHLRRQRGRITGQRNVLTAECNLASVAVVVTAFIKIEKRKTLKKGC